MSFSIVAKMSSIIFERIPSMASSEQTDLRWLLVSWGLLQRGQLWDSRRPQELRYALVTPLIPWWQIELLSEIQTSAPGAVRLLRLSFPCFA